MYDLNFLLSKCAGRYSLGCVLGTIGLSRDVEWVYLAEDFANMSFIKNSELVITTGYFVTNGTSLYDFVSALIKRNTAGVIINIGKYITMDDITEEVSKLCKDNDFALLTMPWSVHLSDIMQELCSILINGRTDENNLNNAFKALIETPQNKALYFDILMDNGFGESYYYTVLMSEKDMASQLNKLNLKYHIMEYKGGSIAVICSEKNFLLSENMFNTSVGISTTEKGFLNLGGLCKQALIATRAMYITGETLSFYGNIGILGIVLAVEDEFLLESYCKSRLSVINDYDTKHNSELTETLFYYLKTGCSPAETAILMCAHRNTITYRINKIKELCNKSFDTTEERDEYLTAIYLYKYLLKLKKKHSI